MEEVEFRIGAKYQTIFVGVKHFLEQDMSDLMYIEYKSII